MTHRETTDTPRRSESVYEAYLTAHPGEGFALIRLGPSALTHVHFVEEEFLVPSAFAQDLQAGATISQEMLMAAAWEALGPMARHGAGPALGAQVLVAVGGNQQRSAADPRRHVRLVLSALDGFRGRGLPRHEGRGCLELGRALTAQGSIPDAVTAYARGRALLEEAGDDHGLRAAHARLAALMARLGLFEQSLLHAEDGQRIGRRLGDGAPGSPSGGHEHFTRFLHHQRARALTRIGLVQEAEAELAQWRESTGDGDDHDLLAATAELRISQERTDEAVEAYIRAIDARFADLRVAALPGRTFYLENSATVFGGAVGSAMRMGRADLAIGMLAAMASRGPARPDGAPASGTAVLRGLDTEIAQLARTATGAAVARDRRGLHSLGDRARMLLETREAVLHESSSERRRVTVTDLARSVPRAVRPGELLLHYGRSSEDEVVLFAVTGGTVRDLRLNLGTPEVERLTSDAHEECLRRAGSDALNRLGEAVLAPVADLIPAASRIHVVTQSILEDFPFHAAPFRGRPLVTYAEVRLLPSLAPLRPDGVRRPERPADRPARAVVAAVRRPRYELLPELQALRAEAAAVRATFPDTTGLYDDDATASAVHSALGTADVLHLAGHAAFEPAHPNMARLLLADRPLFAFEIACADRVPALVNLSGCRAGAERRSLGGEGEGLAAAFLAAGAQTVVAPQWPVRDDAALRFNELLYGQLSRPGTPLGQAVRDAQLGLMTDSRFGHPGLWGAFTMLGGL
ncbi:CHAT domain-containing protein [Streptomyces sp. NPDC050211]|uniref:CHAT domain-containing protein n=1 Tax=Streptomyces sp. NPDC050211 TaxID=3154932 RepID=UPI00343147B6